MLDRTHAHVILDERAGKARIAHVFATRRNTDRLGEIGAAEHDAGIDRRRTQGHVHLLARVQTDARRADHVFERALLDHFSLESC